ncbi:hypothetical protein C8Q80DRAFT_1112492 [Daedaleopsis nitida]|nr:hypothetical protein C8Q80DRAFT_1112492 [Daedaleopsis nitida]
MLADATGGVVKRMSWRPLRYSRRVVGMGGLILEGWPPDIPFGHPKRLPGGRATILLLIKAWDDGFLRFEHASAEAIRVGKKCSKADLPGTPLPEPAPTCYGPFQKKTFGKRRPGTNKKKPKTGPKTPQIVDESKYQFD